MTILRHKKRENAQIDHSRCYITYLTTVTIRIALLFFNYHTSIKLQERGTRAMRFLVVGRRLYRLRNGRNYNKWTTRPRCGSHQSQQRTRPFASVADTTPAVVQPFLPVDFQIASHVDGEESHILTIDLEPGQGVRAEAGALIYMTQSIEMETKFLAGAMNRFLTGQSVFLTDYVARETAGQICLGTDFPSKILRLSLEEYGSLVCQRGAFLAANASVQIESEFTKSLTAGFFGGQGFILQRLSGEGDVFVKGGGTVVIKDLKEGERLRMTSGSIIAFQQGMDFDVAMMPGIKNAMFGGEGLFVTILTGPGRLWLQGMPPDRMISEIASRVPSGGPLLGIPIGAGIGSGGADPAATGAADEAIAGESNDDAVSAGDAAVDADRQATVASSGLGDGNDGNADSGYSLFGDAAPKSVGSDNMPGMNESSSTSESFEPTFSDDDVFASPSSSHEPTFDDSQFNSSSDSFEGDGEIFDESGSTNMAEAAGDEGGGGLLSQLWDLFTGNDD
jgi:uncharacterized protein (TIGR00266 family)